MTPVVLTLRMLLVAVIAAIVGVGALTLSNRQSDTFTADSRLLFSSVTRPELQVLGTAFSRPQSDPETYTATQAALFKSRSVAEDVHDASPRLGSADAIYDSVNAAALGATEVVAISAEASTPRKAEDILVAYRQAFIRKGEDVTKRRAGQAADALRSQLRRIPSRQRGRGPAAALRDQIAALETLREIGSGTPEVVDKVRASATPTAPKTERNTVFGVLFGLVLGIGLLALRAEMKRRQPAAAGHHLAEADERDVTV